MAWQSQPGDPLLIGFPFRPLDDTEEADFEAHARSTPPDLTKWDLMHPVCRRVWAALGQAPGTAEGI